MSLSTDLDGAREFDGYHRWMGIPKDEQPPHYYRLLGVPLFEEDAEVIANGADSRLTSLRQKQTGPHRGVCTRMLNEVAQARLCLLNPERKADYDQRLYSVLYPKVESGGFPGFQKELRFTTADNELSIVPRSRNRRSSLGIFAGVALAVICTGAIALRLGLFSDEWRERHDRLEFRNGTEAVEAQKRGESTTSESIKSRKLRPVKREKVMEANSDAINDNRNLSHITSRLMVETPESTSSQQDMEPANEADETNSVAVDSWLCEPSETDSNPSATPKPQTQAISIASRAFFGMSAGESKHLSHDMKFRWCPAGSFTMGSPINETGRTRDLGQVEVTLSSGFWLGETEITQGQWESLMETAPWSKKANVKIGKEIAASYIGQEDALAYCARLTQREQSAGRLPAGWEFVLPTEAQWEYACRAGTKTEYCFGDDEARLGEYAWYDKNADAMGEDYAHEVAKKRPNSWGFHDMHGNVWEWCADSNSSKLTGGLDPISKVSNSVHVYRGGAWSMSASFCRSAMRSASRTPLRGYFMGVRVAIIRSLRIESPSDYVTSAGDQNSIVIRRLMDRLLHVESSPSRFAMNAAQTPANDVRLHALPTMRVLRNRMVLADKVYGREQLIWTRPSSWDTPATIDFSKITKRYSGTLTLMAHTYPSPGRGSEVAVLLDGKPSQSLTVKINGASWHSISFAFDHNEVIVEHRANGQELEGMLIDYRIEGDALDCITKSMTPQDKRIVTSPQDQERINLAFRRVSGYDRGYVVIGKVAVEAGDDPSHVTAQMQIMDDGFFATETANLSVPLCFRMHNYAPIEVQLKGKTGNLIDVGFVTMRRLSPDKLVPLKGHLTLEGSNISSTASVMLQIAQGRSNIASGKQTETENAIKPSSVIRAQVSETGEVHANGFSPTDYSLTIKAPGHAMKRFVVAFQPDVGADIGSIHLETSRRMVLKSMSSTGGPFNLVNVKLESVVGGNQWTASPGAPGPDLEFEQMEQTIRFKFDYPSCCMADLGAGQLEDFLNVSEDKAKSGPQSLTVQADHVYLLSRKSSNRKVLFKVVAIE